jgi:hypothetical protein
MVDVLDLISTKAGDEDTYNPEDVEAIFATHTFCQRVEKRVLNGLHFDRLFIVFLRVFWPVNLLTQLAA